MDENNFKASTSHESKRKRSKNLESTTINESFVDIEKNLIVSQIEQNTTEDIQLSSDKNHIQNECLFQTPTEIQGNLETNTAYKIKDEDNKGSETKLIQKELLTEEELESSQSTSKLEVSTETTKCKLEIFQNKLINTNLHATRDVASSKKLRICKKLK